MTDYDILLSRQVVLSQPVSVDDWLTAAGIEIHIIGWEDRHPPGNRYLRCRFDNRQDSALFFIRWGSL